MRKTFQLRTADEIDLAYECQKEEPQLLDQLSDTVFTQECSIGGEDERSSNQSEDCAFGPNHFASPPQSSPGISVSPSISVSNFGRETPSKKSIPAPSKTKAIRKSRYERDSMPSTQEGNSSFNLESNSEEESTSKKSSPYPTNNFLATIKCRIFKFLKARMGVKFLNHEVIKPLIKKSWVGMTDFQNIFNDSILRVELQRIFSNKCLYRELNLSRAVLATKILYMRYIPVIEDAFTSGIFDHIN